MAKRKRELNRSDCVDCGRRIIVLYRGKAYIPEDDSHDLCRQCFKRELDRNRSAQPWTGLAS